MSFRAFYPWILIFLLGGFSACGNPPAKPENPDPVPPAEMFFERPVSFSKPGNFESVAIGYYGENLLDTLVYFKVLDPLGLPIFEKNWNATEFLDPLVPLESDSAKETYILDAMERLLTGTDVPDSARVQIPSGFRHGPFVLHYQVGALPPHALAWSIPEKKIVHF